MSQFALPPYALGSPQSPESKVAVVLLLAVCFLAWSNGANDNFKGVASLYGSGTASYRVCLAWATVTTLAGSAAACFLAAELLKKFSGNGLVPSSLAATDSFAVAVATGAGLTVLFAARVGMPISTTHALTGAMLGSGWMAVGGQVDLGVLGRAFVLPLLLGPVAAVALGALLYVALHGLRLRLGISQDWCLCAGEEAPVRIAPLPPSAGAVAFTGSGLSVSVGTPTECAQRYSGRVLGLDSQQVIGTAHFLTAGLVSFARGLNDTPKMAGLLLVLPALGVRSSMLVLGVCIAVGGILGARRVAETMSHKISAMNPGQGLAANISTGLLVLGASTLGLPVSTTHVSVGSIVGIGLTGQSPPNRSVVRSIVLAWVVTLPCAAASAAVVFALLP